MTGILNRLLSLYFVLLVFYNSDVLRCSFAAAQGKPYIDSSPYANPPPEMLAKHGDVTVT